MRRRDGEFARAELILVEHAVRQILSDDASAHTCWEGECVSRLVEKCACRIRGGSAQDPLFRSGFAQRGRAAGLHGSRPAARLGTLTPLCLAQIGKRPSENREKFDICANASYTRHWLVWPLLVTTFPLFDLRSILPIGVRHRSMALKSVYHPRSLIEVDLYGANQQVLEKASH